MKSSRIRLALLAILGGASLAHADILILKNGTRIEGNILQESPEGIRMRYRLTPKIWDEKTFPRTDIQEGGIIKQSPEEVEAIELRKLMPTPDLMPADKYEQLIQDRLRPFVNKYKGTKEAKEIEEMITKLQEEKGKVASGQVKLDGQWLSAEDAKAEQFTIEAYQSLGEIRAEAAQGKWSQAMRAYDAFLAKGPALRATRYYPIIVTEVIDVLSKWSAQLTKMISEHNVLKKERDEGLKKLEGAEREATKAAIAQESDAWRAEAAAMRSAKQRWYDPNKYDIVSLQGIQKNVTTEKAKLQVIDLEATRVQNEALGAVLKKIALKDYAGGAHAYGQILHLRSSPQYKDIVMDFEKRLKAIYAELVSRQRATSMVAPTGATGAASATGQDNLVASILAETSGAPKATAPAAATPGAAPGTTAPAAAVPGAAAPAARPTVAPAPAAPRPAPAPAVSTAVVDTAATEGESNMQMYMMIGAGVLVLVLLVAFMGQKKKTREE